MLDNGESLKSRKPKQDLSKENKKSKGRVITVQDAVLHPNKDLSKENKTSIGYTGTVQDTSWWIPKEPDDCGRKDFYYWNQVEGEYEN